MLFPVSAAWLLNKPMENLFNSAAGIYHLLLESLFSVHSIFGFSPISKNDKQLNRMWRGKNRNNFLSKILSVLILIAFAGMVSAQNYQPVDAASAIKFVIQNFGMATEGTFTGLQGNISFNPADPASALFSVSVETKTVNTEIDVRDKSLLTAEYLDAEKYPLISFTSKKITATANPDVFLIKGTIHLKGIDKDISFPFKVMQKEAGLLFTGSCKILRRDFKIGVGSLVLSDNITISLSVFAKRT